MKNHFFQRFLSIPITIALLFGLTGCGGPSEDELRAKGIYEKAVSLRAKGQVRDALREMGRLVDFSETNVFKQAEAALMEEGISIKTPLQSWTLKEMIKVQNELIRQGKDWHPDGEVSVTYSKLDAWGRTLVIEYSLGNKYSFVVASAGKDRTFGTDDDLKIYNRYKPGERRKNRPQNNSLKRVSTSGSGLNPAGHKADTPRESVVHLQDLLINN